MVLPFFLQLHIECAEARYLHHQRAVVVRLLLRVLQHFPADDIKLHLESSTLEIYLDRLRDLPALFCAGKSGRVEFYICLLYTSRCV